MDTSEIRKIVEGRLLVFFQRVANFHNACRPYADRDLPEKLRCFPDGAAKGGLQSLDQRVVGGIGWFGAFLFFLNRRFWRSRRGARGWRCARRLCCQSIFRGGGAGFRLLDLCGFFLVGL